MIQPLLNKQAGEGNDVHVCVLICHAPVPVMGTW